MSVENLTNEIKKRHTNIDNSISILEQKIDEIDIPTTLAELTEDSTHRVVSDEEKTAWSNKSDFSGSYSDLTNKPTIPTKTSELTNDSNFLDSNDSASIYEEISRVEEEIPNIYETWTFTLADGTVVSKKVLVR